MGLVFVCPELACHLFIHCLCAEGLESAERRASQAEAALKAARLSWEEGRGQQQAAMEACEQR